MIRIKIILEKVNIKTKILKTGTLLSSRFAWTLHIHGEILDLANPKRCEKISGKIVITKTLTTDSKMIFRLYFKKTSSEWQAFFFLKFSFGGYR